VSDHPRPISAVLRQHRFNWIWLVPIVAVGISLYLGVRFLSDRGPLVTITFKTGNGITPGQTQVQHKAVPLGMVETMHLSRDLSTVIVHVRMKEEGDKILTDHARFWVERPRLTPGNISGLETLVSGAYIEVDPGPPGGKPAYAFTGLEEPPGVRSDVPGTMYRLHASRLGSVGEGTPVFYRDVSVGEVLSYDLGNGLGPVDIRIFVRAPYDRFVRPQTHFWNTSGVSVNIGPQGFHVELQSLQAVFSGGVAFKTASLLPNEPRSPAGTEFRLYDSETDADNAEYTQNIPFVTYFTSSVSGLSRGSAVEMFGLRVGTVTDVELMLDAPSGRSRVRVAFDLQPQRLPGATFTLAGMSPAQVTASLVAQGMRAVLASSNFLTGQQVVSLQYVPAVAPAQLGTEGNALLLPSQAGGLDNITTSLSDIATKLDAIPFDQIGRDVAATLKNFSGPEFRQTMHDLGQTMAQLHDIARKANAGATPLLKRLPQLSQDLQQTLARANGLLGENGYGGNSDFSRDMKRLLDQVNETARSIRLLVDFLDRHPEALIRGRTASSGER
jgi:paraquat-inducible protein B